MSGEPMQLMKCTFKPGVYLPLGPTWWRVLDVDREADTALLIADKSVCESVYHKEWVNVTWETCDLRKWLNSEYYETAFSEEEKQAINETDLENPDNPDYHTHSGNNTTDSVFLLSIEEVKRYFKNDADRSIGSWWWLRSPGNYGCRAALVHYGGLVYAGGGNVDDRSAVRPALKINLKSALFQSMIDQESDQSIMVQIPAYIIKEGVLLSANPGLQTAEIPEGVKELAKESFKGHHSLISMTLPSTLKKMGAEAFSGCKELQTVYGADGAIAYGKDVFEDCKKLQYTEDMFRNAGKLCDSFVDHLDVCGAEELAFVRMYQSGKCWEDKLPQYLTAENADQILSSMTRHLQEKRKAIKKPAEAAAAFVKANILLFSRDTVCAFLEMLEQNKMAALSEELKGDPAVNALINGEESLSVGERVCPDGRILYGNHSQEIGPGAVIVMGSTPAWWRILDVDREAETALLIVEKAVCYREYHGKFVSVTWETCDLRKWLNGEYYETAFSEEEKHAIIETDLENPDNPEYHTGGGNKTRDRVFLLSIEEIEKYFKNDADRSIGSWWWLRSPGLYSTYAAFIRNDGSVHARGYGVRDSYAVRPALKINLRSDLLQSMIRKEASGEEVLEAPEFIIRNGTVISASRTLQTAEIPSYVTQIGTGAFSHCPSLTSVVCKGTLAKIAEHAFYDCPSLTSVVWKGAVTQIAEHASYNCPELSSVSWSGKAPEIHKDAFYGCPKATLPADFFCKGKALREAFVDYVPDDPVVWTYILLHEKPGRYMWRMFRHLTTDNAAPIAGKVLEQIANGRTLHNPDDLARFIVAVQPWIGEDQRERFRDLLKENEALSRYLWLLKYDSEADVPDAEPADISSAISYVILSHPIEERLLEIIPSITHVLASALDYAGMYETGYVEDKEYKNGVHKEYERRERTDQLATSLNHTALMEILRIWANQAGPKWYAPYAVYANEEELAALITEMKSWEKDKNLRSQIIRVRGAVFLNDTVTAMRYADSIGQLDYYASLRGLDADEIRDNIISDFGLDEQGRRTWTLAGRTLTATLQPDLTLTLTDEEGKALRSVPKKGADPQEYEAVNREFTAMKKNIRTTAKSRNDRIFEDFLSGRERPAEAWKSAYLRNPVLRVLARLIVWEQEKNTYILDEDGTARGVDGLAYTITGEPIRVAHPMEMSHDSVEAWQNYFVEKGMKQPFEQVWEPVADASLVRPGRYDGCTIPLYMLMNKDKHGIIMEGRSRITLKDCTAGLKYIEGHHDWINNVFEVTDFHFKKYTRQVNHIVVHLDKGIVAGRIKKDDVSAAQWFDCFTQAQITEFINLALENNAVNVLAQLMEYKNQHFPDIDPMDRFILDW